MNGILISIKYQYSTVQLNKLKIERVRKQNGVETTIMQVAKIPSNWDWNSL